MLAHGLRPVNHDRAFPAEGATILCGGCRAELLYADRPIAGTICRRDARAGQMPAEQLGVGLSGALAQKAAGRDEVWPAGLGADGEWL